MKLNVSHYVKYKDSCILVEDFSVKNRKNCLESFSTFPFLEKVFAFCLVFSFSVS